jgi:hypothetical protein
MTSTPTEQDRRNYLDLTRIQLRLNSEARGMFAVAANVVTDPTLGEYAQRRTAILTRGYEQMGAELAALHDEARGRGDSYFEILTGESA